LATDSFVPAGNVWYTAIGAQRDLRVAVQMPRVPVDVLARAPGVGREFVAAEVGRQLLDYTGIHVRILAGLSRRKTIPNPVPRVDGSRANSGRGATHEGGRREIDELSSSCADILKHKDALWTFVDEDGVEHEQPRRARTASNAAGLLELRARDLEHARRDPHHGREGTHS